MRPVPAWAAIPNIDPTDEEVASRKAKLRNLPQNKGKDDDELSELARISLGAGNPRDYLSSKDQKRLEAKLARLRTDFKVNNSSDEALIYRWGLFELECETIAVKLAYFHRQIAKKQSDRDDKKPNEWYEKQVASLNETLRENTKAILRLGEALGIDRKSRLEREGGETPQELIDNLLVRAQGYMREHEAEFTWQCPKCQSMNLLHRRHPFFDDDRAIWSPEVWELYTAGRLTAADAAHVLRISAEGFLEAAKERGLNDADSPTH